MSNTLNTKMIRDGKIVDNDWLLIATDGEIPPSGKIIVPLALWLIAKSLSAHLLNTHQGEVGVWLDGNEDVSVLVGALDSIPLIAIQFPKFADGRGYSTAALLRTRYGFTGELRAIGDVLRDQLFYMQRVGFNAFVVRADKDIDDAVTALNDFSETYQASTDQPQPLFRRRVQLQAVIGAA